ncbi:AraC family transcriptional regulator [Reinekea sp.]|jgi:AraC-like DNA-binding protein|uniref:helix-turn-helix transcriptional regulator n=1 Tax=Reinekea sp. TaxID=1970455 RepID=UPI0039894B66
MHLDRLSTLFQHAEFNVISSTATELAPALDIREIDADSIKVTYLRHTQSQALSPAAVKLDFGGPQSALYQAIPETLTMTLTHNSSAWAMAHTVLLETNAPRCGSPVMLNRLIEVLLIYLLRDAIEHGTQMPGMLLGLADDHLKFALVAVHDSPGHPWTVDELARISGVSRTLFYKRFNELVGCSPLHYLRQWRMTLARGYLIKGKRITSVARDMGYRSNEGFSRAFHQHFGVWPSECR